MGMDTVVEDIRHEARARAEEIRQAADERAEAIIAEARTEAETIRETAQENVDRRIEQEREQKLSSAKLEAKQERLRARRAVLEEVRTDVEEHLASLEGERRRDLTETLLDDAAAEFADVDSVRVYGASSDEDLIADLLADRAGFEYAGDVDCLGGVVVESDASNVRVNNTFDSVIEDVWENRLKDISDRLFEE